MGNKKRFHSDPKAVIMVLQGLEEKNSPVAKILKKHIDPTTGIPFREAREITPPLISPTEKTPKKSFQSGIENSLPRGDRDEEK